MNAVTIRNVSVRFGRRQVLHDVSLEVPAGTTTVLLGANGAGKSTLLRACLGVVATQSGEIRVAGEDPARRRARVQRRVGYVPDVPDVDAWMTARSLFAFLAPHFPTWSKELAERGLERLRAPKDEPFSRMSRGQQMKVMLAAALAPDPSVLLLDEPFGGLDPLVREEVLRDVVSALGEGGARTILLATHDLDIAARIADRVAVIADGRIRFEGTLDDLPVPSAGTPAAHRLRETLAAMQEVV